MLRDLLPWEKKIHDVNRRTTLNSILRYLESTEISVSKEIYRGVEVSVFMSGSIAMFENVYAICGCNVKASRLPDALSYCVIEYLPAKSYSLTEERREEGTS